VAVAPPVGRVILVAAGVARSGRVLLAGLSRWAVVAEPRRRALMAVPGRWAVVAVPGRWPVVAVPGRWPVIVIRVPEIGRTVGMVGMGRSRWDVVLLVAEGQAGRCPVALVLVRQPGRNVIPVAAGQTVVVPMAMLEARGRRRETR
jgi:hypothetical protein